MKTKIRTAFYARNNGTLELCEAHENHVLMVRTVETRNGKDLSYKAKIEGSPNDVTEFVVSFPLPSAEILSVETDFTILTWKL